MRESRLTSKMERRMNFQHQTGLHRDLAEIVLDGDASLDEARVLAAAFGYVLGAASMCQNIEEARVAVTAERLAEILKNYGDEATETLAAKFGEAFADGKSSLATGEIDEHTVKKALDRTEQILGR
jgi:hypothetical protein